MENIVDEREETLKRLRAIRSGNRGVVTKYSKELSFGIDWNRRRFGERTIVHYSEFISEFIFSGKHTVHHVCLMIF